MLCQEAKQSFQRVLLHAPFQERQQLYLQTLLSHFLSFIGFPHVPNIVLPCLNLRMLVIPFPYMVCRFVYPLDLFRRQLKHLLIEPVHQQPVLITGRVNTNVRR